MQLASTSITAVFPATIAEDRGFLEPDGNQASRQKSRSPRTWWWKHYTQAQLQVMLQQVGDGRGGILHGGFNPQYMAFTWQEAQKLTVLVTNASVPRANVSPNAQSSSLMSYPSFQCMDALNEIQRGIWVRSLKRANFRNGCRNVECKMME